MQVSSFISARFDEDANFLKSVVTYHETSLHFYDHKRSIEFSNSPKPKKFFRVSVFVAFSWCNYIWSFKVEECKTQ